MGAKKGASQRRTERKRNRGNPETEDGREADSPLAGNSGSRSPTPGSQKGGSSKAGSSKRDEPRSESLRAGSSNRGNQSGRIAASRGPARSQKDAVPSPLPQGPLAPRREAMAVISSTGAPATVHEAPRFRYPAPAPRDDVGQLGLIKVVSGRSATEQEYEELFYHGMHDRSFWKLLRHCQNVAVSRKQLWAFTYLNLIGGYCVSYQPMANCPSEQVAVAERILDTEYRNIHDPMDPDRPRAPDLRVINYAMQRVADLLACTHCINDANAAAGREFVRMNDF